MSFSHVYATASWLGFCLMQLHGNATRSWTSPRKCFRCSSHTVSLMNSKRIIAGQPRFHPFSLDSLSLFVRESLMLHCLSTSSPPFLLPTDVLDIVPKWGLLRPYMRPKRLLVQIQLMPRVATNSKRWSKRGICGHARGHAQDRIRATNDPVRASLDLQWRCGRISPSLNLIVRLGATGSFARLPELHHASLTCC